MPAAWQLKTGWQTGEGGTGGGWVEGRRDMGDEGETCNVRDTSAPRLPHSRISAPAPTAVSPLPLNGSADPEGTPAPPAHTDPVERAPLH